MSEPENLESFISAKFTALALSIPEDDVSQDPLAVPFFFFVRAPTTGQPLIG
jgi:hypothetical protein